jgi:hypothetical protein
MMPDANQSLQRSAGLRFSRFVAQWPAAAEFLRWAVERSVKIYYHD